MENLKMKFNFLEFVKKNRFELIILAAILAVGAFMRLYRISDYMTFLGDEGRDVIIVRRLLVELHPPLIGPGTSIGNMYLGPLYYYMMAPALLLANFSPVGPAVQIAFLGIITIGLVWWVGREWFSPVAGLIAAGLYSISPTVITYARSSWNPNIMPFFALLSIYSLWRIWSASANASARRIKEFKWLIVLGVAYAFVLQSHYLGLLLAPVLVIFWILTFRNLKSVGYRPVDIGHFMKYSLLALGIFALLMSPLVIFDARHGWNNSKALWNFFTVRQSTVSFRPWNAIPNAWPIWQEIVTSLLTAKNAILGSVAAILGLAGVLTLLIRIKRVEGNSKKAYFLLFVWLGFALLGIGLYKQEIYDHYFGFIFAVPFLLLGALIQELGTRHKGLVGKTIIYCVLPIALGVLAFINIENSPIRYPPNKQLERSQTVAKKILDESEGRPFDLAVLAERNYEDGYRYFLLVWGATVLHADIWDKATIADQLFVVCEKPKDKCDPTHDPKAEVANFGMSKIETQWDEGGVTLYKLVHTK
jgi:4-amino-4-deoxy-L-arabinose transferase-like glycosyltransferase